MRRTIALLAGLLTLALAGTASAAVPGLNLVVGNSGPPDSDATKPARAACPPGQNVLGVGGKSERGGGQIMLESITPLTDGSTLVEGSEDQDGFAGDWSVKAYAICADVDTTRRRTPSEPFDSFAPKLASTEPFACPGSTRLTGSGAQIPLGQSGQVLLDGMVPSTDLEWTEARGDEDQDGHDGNWSLRPWAICADPLPGLELETARSASNSQNKHVTAVCAPGKRVVGTGGRIFGGGGEVAFQYIIPDAALTRVSVRGVEDQDGRATNWSVNAYAVCATA